MKKVVEVAEFIDEREQRKRKCHQHKFEIVKDKRDFQEYSVQPFSFICCQVFKKLPEKPVIKQSSLSDSLQ